MRGHAAGRPADSLSVCVWCVIAGGGGQEQWPGPFSTARQMIRERDAAAAARQERLTTGQVEEEMEEVKKFKIEWTPRKGPRPAQLHQVRGRARG